MLQINLLYDFIQSGIFVGYYPANTQIEAQVYYFLCLLQCTGKAMKYTTQVLIMFLLQHAINFFKCVPAVYNYRQFQFFSPGNLNPEGFYLLVQSSFIPIQVYSYFAYGIYFMLRNCGVDCIKLIFPGCFHIAGVQAKHGKAIIWKSFYLAENQF